MALFDVDKSSDSRISPSPNSHDVLAQESVMAKQTASTSYKVNAVSTTTRLVQKNNMFIWYDDQNRVSSLYGFVPQISSIPILVIAKAGFDVYIDVLQIPKPAGI